jgi:hypothetical protein
MPLLVATLVGAAEPLELEPLLLELQPAVVRTTVPRAAMPRKADLRPGLYLPTGLLPPR